MHTGDISNELLVPSEVAQMLRTSKASLAVSRCQKRDGPAFLKIGRRVLYSKTAVLAWLEKHVVDPAQRDHGAPATGA